jgi:hypothetical protein
MTWKRKVQGGMVGLIGFLLSPLSWWNDAFVNLPLAVAFGWLIALIHRPAFEPAVVVGYWLTNVAGLILMHKGIDSALSKGETRGYSWRNFARDLAISVGYTLLIVILIKARVLQPISDYFARP